MSSNDMLKTATVQAGQEIGRVCILEMAKASADTLFEPPRIIAVGEQLGVMVALEYQPVAIT